MKFLPLLCILIISYTAFPKDINETHPRTMEQIDSLTMSWYQKDAYSPVVLDEDTFFTPKDFKEEEVIRKIGDIESPFELTYNEYVGNYIKKFISWNEWMGNVLGRSKYYFPMIEEVLDANDIPLELKYLAVVESALKPTALSRVGASGLWQFMYQTGKMYDLQVNSFVDERRDPIKSTNAAAKYMKDMYEIYGDWYLVIAAYNCGPGNVNKAIKRAGGKRDYWDIYPYLPKETRGYVPAFIATAYVMTYHNDYGIPVILPSEPILTDTVPVIDRMNLNQVSEVLNIPMDKLYYLNPQYRKDIIPNDNLRSYTLRLPIEYIGAYIDNEDSILNYRREELVDRRAIVANAAVAKGYSPADIAGKSKIYYKVKSGDSVGLISDWFDVRSSDLSYWNNLVKNRIKVNQTLLVYVPKSKTDYYNKLLNASFKQKQNLVGHSSKNKAEEVSLSKNYIYHKVKAGENPWTIAQQYPGVSSTDIMTLNNIESKGLKPGQNLKIKLKN